jgi:molybdopterin/thiamine biosynthesis adenylyltransferase
MKQQIRLKITEEDFSQVQSLLMADMPNESAVFLLAGNHEGSNAIDLIVRRVVAIPETEYRMKNSYHMDISPKAINGLIALCEENRLGVVLCHSHVQGERYSPSDDYGEKRIADTISQFLPSAPMGSLLMTQSGAFNGRLWKTDGAPNKISSITVIGRCTREISIVSTGSRLAVADEIYDRQVLAFGAEGQAKLLRSKVGIVGVGGTGSAVAEQLVRLGVMDFVLIDPDDFEPTNLTRMHESRYSDAYPKLKKGKSAKVAIIAKHLKEICPQVKIKLSKNSVVKSETCGLLLDRDVIFSCTDDYWGRAVLNQVAHQYLIPVINMGVRIDSIDGKITGAAGDLHILRPGKPCLWCYGLLTSDKIRAESLPSDIRDNLLREGYVEGINSHAPSVVSLTTTIAGLAVTQFLQLVTDFMGQNGDISCLKYNIMDGLVRRGTATINKDCCCQTFKGFGDMKPLFTV